MAFFNIKDANMFNSLYLVKIISILDDISWRQPGFEQQIYDIIKSWCRFSPALIFLNIIWKSCYIRGQTSNHNKSMIVIGWYQCLLV